MASGCDQRKWGGSRWKRRTTTAATESSKAAPKFWRQNRRAHTPTHTQSLVRGCHANTLSLSRTLVTSADLISNFFVVLISGIRSVSTTYFPFPVFFILSVFLPQSWLSNVGKGGASRDAQGTFRCGRPIGGQRGREKRATVVGAYFWSDFRQTKRRFLEKTRNAKLCARSVHVCGFKMPSLTAAAAAFGVFRLKFWQTTISPGTRDSFSEDGRKLSFWCCIKYAENEE